MSLLDDTIVALSSAPGPGARAIVRLSGRAAVAISDRIYLASADARSARGVSTGFLALKGVPSPLPADRYLFPGPHSYTGQTVVEVHCLSSPPLVDALIAELIAAGARPANPGEFTLRAFLAGKIDLPQAEAALATIEASDRDELRAALQQLAGGVSRPLDGLREDLLNLLADLEAGLDFADENIEFVDKTATLNRLAEALARVTLVQKQLAGRGESSRSFRVALIGPPNAGKSRLFNALTGATALVSPEAGTTRDYLVTRIDHAGQSIELIDTAGLRTTDDAIEGDSQRLGYLAASTADCVLICHDSSSDTRIEPPTVVAVLHVATKCDLAPPPADHHPTSAESGLGVAALLDRLAQLATTRSQRGLAPSLSRCHGHVDACLSSLRKAHRGTLENDPPEIIAADLRAALDELGRLIGAIHTDDLLDRIFSRFCIGK